MASWELAAARPALSLPDPRGVPSAGLPVSPPPAALDFRFLIARRYLASRRGVTLVSVISMLSVAGVALGVAALIVVLSVMNGFYEVVRGLLVSFDPHVRIEAAAGGRLEAADSLAALALELPHVVSAAPYVEGKALLGYAGADEAQVVRVRGVAAEGYAVTTGLDERLTAGDFAVARDGNRPGMVVGQTLGLTLGLYPRTPGGAGSTVTLLTAPGFERLLANPLGLPPRQPFEVRGLFAVEPVYDADHVFIELAEAQRLFGLGGGVSGVELRLDDLERADAVQAALGQRLDPARYRVRTWYDLQRALYDVMRLEKWGASLILGLIVLVAAFNIVGSLTMVVIEKRRDLGVLQAMGASPRDIRRVFLLQGLLVGALGAGLGLALGLGLAVLQQQTGFVPLAHAEAFVISSYPVAIRWGDVAAVTASALALCALAALYPATRAAHIEPATAVRGA